MSIDLALAISGSGTVQNPVKGIAAAMTGTEAFADVMAGIALAPGQPMDSVGTGTNLRFHAQPAVIAVEAKAGEGGEAGIPVMPDVASQDRPRAINVAPEAEVDTHATAAISGVVAAADKPGVKRKREADDTLPETTAAPPTPTGTPVMVPIQLVPAAATPEPAASRAVRIASARQGLATNDANPAKKPANPGGIVSILADRPENAGERSMPAQGQALPPATSADSRKGAEPIPASLTMVADIVQNLPPLIQSQVGAVMPGPVAAVGAAPDVGAALSGEAIDMGVGGQWIDRVAREITALAEGSGHSRFQLNPPNLGRLQIDVWQDDGGGRVQLLTETDEAAMRLRQDQASLQADARLSALSLDRIIIDRAPASFGASPDQNGQAGMGRHHPSGGDMADRGAGQSGSQAGQQAAAQHGGNSGSAQAEGKAPQRRDVFSEHAQPDEQEGRASGPTDRRNVRYA